MCLCNQHMLTVIFGPVLVAFPSLCTMSAIQALVSMKILNFNAVSQHLLQLLLFNTCTITHTWEGWCSSALLKQLDQAGACKYKNTHNAIDWHKVVCTFHTNIPKHFLLSVRYHFHANFGRGNLYLAPTACNGQHAIPLQNAVTHWSLRSRKITMFIHGEHVLCIGITHLVHFTSCSHIIMSLRKHVFIWRGGLHFAAILWLYGMDKQIQSLILISWGWRILI